MDNKAYLDQIAVKSQQKNTSPLLSPGLIKLLIGAAIALIAMLIIGNIFSSGNNKVSTSYEDLYYRISTLADTSKSPLATYDQKLKSSDLRSYSSSLIDILRTTKNRYDAISGSVGIDSSNLSSSVTGDFDSSLSALNAKLDDAYLTGQLDRIYAYSMYDQITQLLNLELSISQKTSDQNLAELINNSRKDLESFQKQFKAYSDSH
ncbi:hypothetical protein IKF15_04435 [Candidatus Saccharibacteria bacterium]|nr:hypothetical protein [Candidatus Saccharibacteria bacterium]